MGNSCTSTKKSTILTPARVIQIQTKNLTNKHTRTSLGHTLGTPTPRYDKNFQMAGSPFEVKTGIPPSIEADEEIRSGLTPRPLSFKHDLSELKIGEYYLEKETSEIFEKYSESKKKKVTKTNLKWDRVIVEYRDKISHTILNNSLYSYIDFCFQEFALTKTQSYQKMVRRSIPTRYRWSVWKSQAKIDSFYIEGLYEKFKGLSSRWERDINKDLHRTFPNEPYFSSYKHDKIGQEQLFNVLKAISIYFPNIGYAQSMNFIVAFLLLVSGGNELESFWMFVTMARDYRFLLMGLFEKGFPLLEFFTHIFYQILENESPQLAEHLKQQQIPDLLWLFKWFLTLFLYSFPPKYVIKIWDFVIVHGLFSLVQVALGIVKFLETDMLNLDSFGIDLLFKSLKGENSKIVSQILSDRGNSGQNLPLPLAEKKGTVIVNHASIADLENQQCSQGGPEEISQIQYNFKELDIDEILNLAGRISLTPENISEYAIEYKLKASRPLPKFYEEFFANWPKESLEGSQFQELQNEIDYHLMTSALKEENQKDEKLNNEVVVSLLDEDENEAMILKTYKINQIEK